MILVTFLQAKLVIFVAYKSFVFDIWMFFTFFSSLEYTCFFSGTLLFSPLRACEKPFQLWPWIRSLLLLDSPFCLTKLFIRRERNEARWGLCGCRSLGYLSSFSDLTSIRPTLIILMRVPWLTWAPQLLRITPNEPINVRSVAASKTATLVRQRAKTGWGCFSALASAFLSHEAVYQKREKWGALRALCLSESGVSLFLFWFNID